MNKLVLANWERQMYAHLRIYNTFFFNLKEICFINPTLLGSKGDPRSMSSFLNDLLKLTITILC